MYSLVWCGVFCLFGVKGGKRTIQLPSLLVNHNRKREIKKIIDGVSLFIYRYNFLLYISYICDKHMVKLKTYGEAQKEHALGSF